MSNVFKMPKSVSNAAAEFIGTNSRVGKTYPSKCKTTICNPIYIVDTVIGCQNCSKIKSC